MNSKHILLVSTADWDNPYWTNKQHVALQLAALGHKVFYVESQGLRAPTATGKDLKRIWKRLRRGLTPARQVRPNLWVWSPLNIPFQANAWVRRINKLVLQAGIKLWCAVNGIKPELLWTYSPMTTEFYDLKRFALSVYHAVDDIKTQPGMPYDTIQAAEAVLSKTADIIFVTAPNLYDMHKPLNPATHYFSNVADYAHFNKAMDDATVVPADLTAIAGPRIGFVGAISSYKLDFDLIRSVAQKHPEWAFVFIGEIGEGDPLTDSSKLTGLSNLHFLGGKPYQSLPAYLKGMDVTILPNQINDYTRSMFPMKFFEYLAAGKPVVATDLPALADYSGVATFATSTQGFEDGIENALSGVGAGLPARLSAARDQTYEIRTQKMLTVVEQALQQKAAKSH